uniref:FYVE-type domain-containing protein n=1 Tax=Globisporangium ultimum (strain ATCC 200006 / CBS 805.95 / DAOM BR144) TaxID=431595 RepID=K3X5Y4_GLOUD
MPPKDTSHLFVRGKTLTLQTFSEVSQGNLELYTMMINDLGERLPTWLVHKIVDTAAMRVACIRDHINQKRIDLLVFANPKDLVPLSKRVCCIVCTKSFSLVRKKYNCVACGDVICNQCSVHQLVSSPQGISEFVGKRKARICVKCSSGITAKELPRRSSAFLRHSDLASDASTRSSTPTRYSNERRGALTELENSRNNRSMSSFEHRSSSSSLSNTDDGTMRVHPTAGNPANRATIPHMFQQFRPSATSVRPVAKSTAAPGAAAQDEESEEDDDDMEHELFDANVDITAISPQELDLGVGKYKEVYVQQAQSEHAIESFLAAESSSPSVASFLTNEDNESDCRSSSLQPQMAVTATMEELVVEEVMPGNRSSSLSSQPRRSLLQMHDDADAIGDADQPVIVRKVEKLSIGTGGRRSRDARPRDLPPRPEDAVVETADFTQTADFTGPINLPEEPATTEDTIQLSDLQVHLDRMTQISQSLRNINVNEIEPSTEASIAMRRLQSYEKKANAEAAAAAMIAANFLSRFDRPATTPAFTFAHMSGPPTLNLALAISDGSIAEYLEDSLFSELVEPPEGILDGWQTVTSQTTGKVYYFNEQYSMSSWTVPTAEIFRGATYMVL